MKLARKLTLFLVAGVCVVFICLGWLQLRRDLAVQDDILRREHRVIGQTLQVTADELWTSRGREHALGVIRRANPIRDGVRLRWVSLERGAEPSERPAAVAAALGALERRQIVQTAVAAGDIDAIHGHASDVEHLFTYVPLFVQDKLVGGFEISESLEERAAHSRDQAVAVAVGILCITLLCGLLAGVVGASLVGRPIEALITTARRIGSGDLSARVRAEQRDELGELGAELNAMAARLEQARERLAHEADARVRAVEQLRHADRLTTVGKLASAIAHEIGTPLNVAAGYARVIKKSGDASDAIRSAADVILEQCQRMTNIVRQILDYARRRDPKKSRVDLRDLVASSIALLRPLADQRRVEIELDLGAAQLAEVDAGQLQQAITNLVVNAIQASSEAGTVKLGLAGPVDLADGSARQARITVEDSGVGMDEQTLAHLFEPFFTTKPSGQGTGLGLSITKDIVEEHGGRLNVVSQPAKGSRFDLYLPLGSAT